MKVLAAAAMLCALTSSLWAQGASSLRGTVTDPTKAVIAAAKVTLVDTQAGSTRSAVTSASGEYQFLQVRPGTYKVTVQAAGFGSRDIDGIKLLVDTPATVDVSLDVAAAASSVSVTAETSQLNTVDATVGNAFQEHQIQSLPLQTRNVVQLLSLQPGVTQNGEVMGARRDQNNIMLDGVDNNDNQNPLSGQNGTNPSANSGTTTQGFNSALPIPLDSVQEFRVTVAGENAFAGHSSGGQVSLVTRSGTNELHGSAYEYNRNTDYTANNWFSNRAGVPRAQLVRNQFGASLGGPVKKNRIFYFMNYEARIDSSQQSTTRTVPSEALKSGDITFKTTNGATYTLAPGDVAAIDPLHQGVSPTMLSYLKQFPSINSPATGTNNDGGLNFGGYIFNAPVKLDYRTYVGRFDWLVDSKGNHTVSFRGTLSNNGQTQSVAEFPGQQPASTLLSDNRGFGIRYTAILTPALTNTANVGVTRIGYGQTGATAAALNLGAVSTLQAFTPRGSGRINPTWNFNDDVNWVKGRHTVTGGINFRWIDNNVSTAANAYPSYSFSRGVLVGLGNDIYTSALNYVADGNAALKLANSTAVTNSFGTLLGLLNSNSATYQYDKTGAVLPFG
ncbi:MAG: carboxypeptidase regulatory-like domain-containing protein, partial [Acidobacteriota bacterium]|nr:carboxypeptidase regulatory-like domain-containing protein [Acidobacteriota bacterium]